MSNRDKIVCGLNEAIEFAKDTDVMVPRALLQHALGVILEFRAGLTPSKRDVDLAIAQLRVTAAE